MTDQDVPAEACTCADIRDGYRFDPPTETCVHKRCGLPRPGGPTVESVIEFVDQVLEKRRRRERASGAKG